MPKSGARPKRRKFLSHRNALLGVILLAAAATVGILYLTDQGEDSQVVPQEDTLETPLVAVDSLSTDTTGSDEQDSSTTPALPPAVTPDVSKTTTPSARPPVPKAMRERPSVPVGVPVSAITTPRHVRVVQSTSGRRVVVVHTGTVNVVHSGTIRIIIKK